MRNGGAVLILGIRVVHKVGAYGPPAVAAVSDRGANAGEKRRPRGVGGMSKGRERIGEDNI